MSPEIIHIANNNVSTDMLPFKQNQQLLQRATTEPEYTRPQNKYVPSRLTTLPHY
jgi:hypothetical protein